MNFNSFFESLPESNQLNEEKLISLIEALPDAIFLKDGMGRWQHINSVAKRLFRLEDIDWQGKTDAELAEINLPLRDAHLYCITSDLEVWGKGVLTKMEEMVPDEAGKIHYFEVTKVPLFYDDKSQKGLVIIGKDITIQEEIENEQRLNHQIQKQLNDILKISLENISIKECLDKILSTIISAPFISLQKKGGVFLTDESKQRLKLVSHSNYCQHLQAICKQINFGQCLCGMAALTKSTIHVSSVDERHENTYPEIQPHGHYNVPILFQNEVLGVIVIYLNDGHLYNKTEVQFLESVADIISGILNRKKSEEQVIISLKLMENIDRINNILLKTGSYEKMEMVNKELLDTILDIFEADRSWLIYPCDPNAKTWTMSMNCYRNGYSSIFEIGKKYNVTDEDKKLYKHALGTSEPIVFEPLENIYENNELGSKLVYKSAIAIAIHSKNGKPWLLGIDQCSYRRIWTNDEKRLLKQIAVRISESVNSFSLLDKLRKSEIKYRSLSETAIDIIVSYDLKGKINYMNSVGLSFFGLKENNYKDRNVFDFFSEYDKNENYKKYVDGNELHNPSRLIEVNLLNQKGEVIPFEISSSPIELKNNTNGLISIARNITDRKLAEEKLIKQNTELQTINSELDKFVYRTSHDLRAPLTSVMGLINIIRDGMLVETELNTYMGMMEMSIQRLDNVIKSIIDYSKSNRLHVNNESIDIGKIYNDIIESLSFIKGSDSLKHYHEIKYNTTFFSDKIGINTIIGNLVSNAVKYRRDNTASYVNFSFTNTEKEGIIIVEDNGEGIPEDKHNKVFDMFYRNSSSAEGSGLGLYIVKQYVIKLKGSIDLKSVPGKGSSFIVKLPNNIPYN